MDGLQPTERRCKKCGEVKPFARFRPHGRRHPGRSHTCYDCFNAEARAKRAENVEEWRRKKRVYYHANREAELARMHAWKEANPRHKIRQRFLVRGGDVPEESIEYGLILDGDPCCYCGGPSGSIDHIVALEDGGTHDWENLTAACKSCNCRKQRTTLLDFLMRDRLTEEMENWSMRWEQAA